MTSDATMTLTVDGVTTAPFTLDDLKAATGKLKETAEDEAVRDKAYSVTARELRSFVERYERVEEEKAELAEQLKDVLRDAKARGYDTKVLKKLIALRKRDKDEVSEEAAILALYRDALGC